MDEHAEFAPSSAERWLACPGSICLSKAVEDEPQTSEAAEIGTAAHWLFEDYKGRVNKDEAPNGIQITNHMRNEVRRSLRRVKQEVGDPHMVLKEYRTAIWEQLTLKKSVIWGTVDLVILGSDRAWLIDFKYGKYKVPVENNKQLMTYAVGILPLIYGVYDQLTLVIVQPRAGGDLWNEHTISVIDIQNWAMHLQSYFRARKSKEFRRTFKAGDHCFFCLAKHICSARLFEDQL